MDPEIFNYVLGDGVMTCKVYRGRKREREWERERERGGENEGERGWEKEGRQSEGG